MAPPTVMRIAIALLALCACGSEGTGTEVATTPPQTPQAPLSGARPRGMKNCPAAVPGARTVMTRTPQGADLTITADADEARSEIQARTRAVVGRPSPRPGAAQHTGRGGGPELIGFCPVISLGNDVSYQMLPAGVRVEMRARNPVDVEQLQARVEQRARALRAEVPTT